MSTPAFVDENMIKLDKFKTAKNVGKMSQADKNEFKKLLNNQKKAVVGDQDIDLLLLMDCTASMGSWIK